MNSRFDLLKPFILIGAGLWIMNGFMVSMICFEPIYSVLKGDPAKMIKLSMDSWGGVTMKTAIVWALLGGIFGLITALIFFSRPWYEHSTRAPSMSGISGNGITGPKTIAELNTSFRSWFLGYIMIVLAATYLLPLFQTDLVVVKGAGERVFITFLLGLTCIVPVLPFSLIWLYKKLNG